MKEFLTSSSYFKQVFGQKVYKIALSCSHTCPNRDGSKGLGGCIFCSEKGSGDFTYPKDTLPKQIKKAKALVNSKFKGNDKKYIAYAQNFSNTYGNAEHLEAFYNEVLEDKDIIGLSIATRPDCLPTDILQMLKRLSYKTHLIIELGLQTSNEETGLFINRCYTNEDYKAAICALKAINPNIHVITHVIFGLPKESEEDMLKTIKFVVENKTDGIKIALLHVLKGTKLYQYYQEGLVPYYSEENYFKLLVKALEIIPTNIIIHRLTGDGPKALLISPLWTGNKKQVLNALNKALKENGIILL